MHLEKKDQVTYNFITSKKKNIVKIECSGGGRVKGKTGEFTQEIQIRDEREISFLVDKCKIGKNQLTIECVEGYADVDVITIL